MDAFKPDNNSTDADNLSSNLLDTDLTTLDQDESPSLDAILEDLSGPQSLEEEFSDVTQQAASSSVEFEMNAPEQESGVDLDEEFAAFQMLQQPNNNESPGQADLGLENQSIDIDELLLDEAFEVKTNDSEQGNEALINPFEIAPSPASEKPDLSGIEPEKKADLESELSAVEALLGGESASVSENESESIEMDPVSTDEAKVDVMLDPNSGLEMPAVETESEPAEVQSVLEEISGLDDLGPEKLDDEQSESSASQESKLDELLNHNEEGTEVTLELELDSEPDLIADPLSATPVDTDESVQPASLDMDATSAQESSFEPMDLMHNVSDLEMSADLERSDDETSSVDLTASEEESAHDESLPSEKEASTAMPNEQESEVEVSLELELDSDPDLVSESVWANASEEGESAAIEADAALDEALDLDASSVIDDALESAIASEVDNASMLDEEAQEEVAPPSMSENMDQEDTNLPILETNDGDAVAANDSSNEEMSDEADNDARVLELEAIVQQNQAQIEELQALVNSKIDPEIHTHLLQELRQYKTQASELETSLQALQAEQEEVESPVSIADHESLQQLAEEQKQTIADLQATIARLEQDLTTVQTQLESQIAPSELEELSTQSTAQGELIAKLESEIQTLTADYERAQAESAQKIELGEHQSVQAEVQQLTAQVQSWEQRYDELSQELNQQKHLTDAAVDPEAHASLNQTLQEYEEQIKALQSENASLQEAVQTWQGQAQGKVERAEYDAVLEQLQRLKEKNARSFWTRIMDWFMGK